VTRHPAAEGRFSFALMRNSTACVSEPRFQKVVRQMNFPVIYKKGRDARRIAPVSGEWLSRSGVNRRRRLNR